MMTLPTVKVGYDAANIVQQQQQKHQHQQQQHAVNVQRKQAQQQLVKTLCPWQTHCKAMA
jgi:hypothetical protein